MDDLKVYLLKNKITFQNLFQDKPLYEMLLKGMPLSCFIDKCDWLLINKIQDYRTLLQLAHSSCLIFRYETSVHEYIQMSSPFLLCFLDTLRLDLNSNQKNENLMMNKNSFLYIENDYLKIQNPFVDTHAITNMPMHIFFKKIESNELLKLFFLENELLSNEIIVQEDSSGAIDRLFMRKTNYNNLKIGEKNFSSITKSIRMKAETKLISEENFNKLNLQNAIVNRSSQRFAGEKVTIEGLLELLLLVFSDLQLNIDRTFYKKIYPSAGSLNVIKPIVQILSDEVDGIRKGVYYYDGQLCKLLPCDFTYQSLNDVIAENPKVCISLVAELEITEKKYGPYSLKLAILDAGVILSYLYIFSKALNLNSSAYGLDTLHDSFLKNKKKEVASFCLY